MFTRLVALPSLVIISIGDMSSAVAAEQMETKRTYNLPSGNAAAILSQFAAESSVSIVFMTDKVAGEQTNALVGEFLPRDAIAHLLHGTNLIARQDERTGGFVVTRLLAAPQEKGWTKPNSQNPTKPNTMPPPKSRKFFRAFAALLLPGVAAADEPSKDKQSERAKEEEIIVLSPFEVSTMRDSGYYAPDTLAGSRMKTNLGDLGASISIVNRAQMEDFALTDVNEMFRYEVNTEGSETYTVRSSSSRGDGLVDTNSGATAGSSLNTQTNAGSNRVRGMSAPGAAYNYYPSLSAVPLDEYNLQSVEISRGPNSMLFGIGSPTGIVNSSTAQASVTRNSNRVQMRVDDLGSFRSSLSFNRYLIRGKLAIYGAFLWDDRKFERKPSYDDTRRQYGAITYKPFSKTTLRANFENFYNTNSRPNTLSPIDYVTQWNLAGKPGYDNLSKTITLLSTGQTLGPYLSGSGSPFSQQTRNYIVGRPDFNPSLMGTSATVFGGTPTTFNFYNGISIFGNDALFPATSIGRPDPRASILYVPGLRIVDNRPIQQIYDGQVQNWFQYQYQKGQVIGWGLPGNPTGTQSAWSTAAQVYANPVWADVYDRNTYSSTGWTHNTFVSNIASTSYRYPGITDKSIYDWENVNIAAANFGRVKNQNYNIDLDQQITEDLFLSAGWLRQDFEQMTNYGIGQLNAAAVRIDVNQRLPNGETNPFFGKPYVADLDPDQVEYSAIEDHFRAMLAYTPDFTKKDGWLRWLGRHQMLGLWTRDDSMGLTRRKRLAFHAAGNDLGKYRYLPNPADNANGTRTGWSFSNSTVSNQNARFYYLASPSDPTGVITSSGHYDSTSMTGSVSVYDYTQNRFDQANVTQSFLTWDWPTRSQKITQSYSAGITSHWWKDRLVTTLGARSDRFKSRSTTGGALATNGAPGLTTPERIGPDGYFNDASIWNRFNLGTYMTGYTKTAGGVFRPFRGWTSIERKANSSYTWQLIREFGLTYNWSNNFDVNSAGGRDFFGDTVGKPQGEGQDIGIQVSGFDNKLFARLSWFKTTNENQPSPNSVGPGRFRDTLDVGYFRGWARQIAMINMGMDPTAPDFGQNLSQPQEDQIRAAAQGVWKLPYDYYASVGSTNTQTQLAEGLELQLNYNTGGWRNRLTFGQQETKISNVMKQYDALESIRLPLMQNARAADYLLPAYQHLATYTTAGGAAVDLVNFWRSYGYGGLSSSGVDTPAGYYFGTVAGPIRLAKDLDGQASPGQRKYRVAYNTGVDFTRGLFKGISVGGAQRWESKMVIGYYGKASGADVARPGVIDISDTAGPIYDEANYYTDAFIRYRKKLFSDKVLMSVQLNVDNVFEDGGRLQVVAVNYDGSPYGYRIIDSRRFKLTATFEF